MYAKLAAERMGGWVKSWGDRGYEFPDQADFQQHIEDYLSGVRLGIRDSLEWKAKYDKIYLSADYTNYHYLCVEFYPPLPIVACGGMHVEYDFQGNSLQSLIRSFPANEHMTFNITVADDVSIMVLGWVGDSAGPSYEFVRSFLLQPEDRLSHTVIRLAFENIENSFMRQSWWEGFGKPTQELLERRARSGSPYAPDRLSTCLVDDNISYFQSKPSTSGIVI
jgi:hypothetical protein